MKTNYSSIKVSSSMVMSIQNKKKIFLGLIQMRTMVLLANLSIDIFCLNNVLLRYCPYSLKYCLFSKPFISTNIC